MFWSINRYGVSTSIGYSHFKTLSLDESRSPDFDLFSDQEEYSEEEIVETEAETMEQYMSKTRADHGSGVARPKIEDKDNFKLKGQFLNELRTNIFSGSDHEDANEHIEKVLEIMDLFHIPSITINQVMLRAIPMSLTGAASQIQEVVLFYNGLDVPTRQILDSRGAIPSRTAADAKVAIQEMAEYSQKWHNGTSRTISPYYTKDCSLKEQGKTLEEAYYTQFGAPFQVGGYRARASVNVMPLLTYLNLGLGELAHTKLIVELADSTVKYPKGIVENMLVGIGKFVFLIDFIILDMLEDVKVPLILERPFLSTAHAKIDVFKRKITLRVGEEKIIFKSVKPASSLIKRVYMLSLRERIELDLEARLRIELDLEARLMGETLVLNRSLDPFFEDFIELNDLNKPLELRRDQVDDLMPVIEEGEVIEEFRTRNDARMVSKIFGYPSNCNHDKKIRIDCAHNLKFSCMIGFEFLHANFFPILYVNVMSIKFYNSIRKDKLEYKGNNVVGALMNVPIFVGTFSILANFAILEYMDAYRDEGMEVTYQMVRSHPRFKHHNNEQCNKIPPLLKVSKEDMMNGISHSYQKLKSFYKGVLNLGPEYVRDTKMEE
ncbi:gag-pol polyprotein [Tanacetum coccineum]